MLEFLYSARSKRMTALVVAFFMMFVNISADIVWASNIYNDISIVDKNESEELAISSNSNALEKNYISSDNCADKREEEILCKISTPSFIISTKSDVDINNNADNSLVSNSISQSDDDLLRLNMHFKSGNVMKKPDVEIYHIEDEMEENLSLTKILEDSYFDDEVRENIENYYDIDMYHVSIHDEKTGEAYKGNANINLKYRYPEDIKDKLDGEFDDIRSSMINTGEVYIDTDIESENMKLRRIMAASDDEKIRLISENLEENDFLEEDEEDSYKEGVLGDNINENLDDREIYEELEDREAKFKFNKKYLEGESTIKNIDEAFNLIVLRRKTIEKPKENNISLNEEKIASASNAVLLKAFALDEEKDIYLDPQNGDDGNTGTSADSAFKTLKYALDYANGNDKSLIYVLSTVNLNEEAGFNDGEDIDLKACTIKRHKSLVNNPVIKITDSRKLYNGIVDGNHETGLKVEAALIHVIGENAKLSLKDIKIKNNYNLETPTIYNTGKIIGEAGGIFVDDCAELIINDGTEISNNTAVVGGGVCVGRSSKVTMNGGIIDSNTAYNNSKYRHESGGGVFICNSSRFILNDGIISSNKSNWFGGGVGVGSLYIFYDDPSNAEKSKENRAGYFEMNGGKIINNTAKDNGGGIFIQTRHIAKITGGEISGNIAESSHSIFAGGGIYVNGNGIKHWNGLTLDNGLLILENALISKNIAKEAGGGLAGCPCSNITIYSLKGFAVYDNGNELGNKDDLYIEKTMQVYPDGHFGSPDVYLSSIMPNGLSNDYRMYDTYDAFTKTDMYFNNGDTALRLVNNTENVYDTYSVIIKDNHSDSRGGGIGSNGNIIIGRPGDLIVKKTVEGRNPAKDQEYNFTVFANNDRGEAIKNGIYGEMEYRI